MSTFYQFNSHSASCMQLIDEISSSVDNKEYCAGIFLDLSKAFDTVNHAILINKLGHYGIRGLALKWTCSHLSDRKQYVECNGVASEYLTVKCGVPQGSILGPLLSFYILMISISHQVYLSLYYLLMTPMSFSQMLISICYKIS